jgi:hypothetical protein
MLGTAAGLVALTGAQAADLPVKAKAVEYVKVCSLYGAGFYYIPGTDTCIRIGGALRLDVAFNGRIYDAPYWQGGAGGANSYARNYYDTRARQNLFLDTRTATEYGVLRTYANIQFDWTQDRENIAGGFVEVDFAFIQFAGFTMGKAVSQFDPQWALSKPTISSGFNAGSNNATGILQLAYTWQFGNGVSGTISLEDATPYRNAGVINTSSAFLAPFASATSNYGVAAANSFLGNAQLGTHVPDIVGNIRVDQAWGSLHFGAAAHEVHGTYYPGSGAPNLNQSGNGKPDAKWGFAATGALELKNLPTGVGDSFKIEGTWARGAAKYVFGGTTDPAGAGRYAKLGGFDGTAGTVGTVAFGYVLDGVYSGLGTPASPGTGIELSTAWDVSAYYEHYWNPQWRTSVFGSYSRISYNNNANTALLAAFNAGGANNVAGTLLGGNFNLGIAQIGTRTAWTPVANLEFAAEFIYSRLDQNLTGTVGIAGVAGQVTPSTFAVKDQNLYNGGVRVLRSF